MDSMMFVLLPFLVFFAILLTTAHRPAKCPHCGETLQPARKINRKLQVGLLVLFVLIGVGLVTTMFVIAGEPPPPPELIGVQPPVVELPALKPVLKN